VVSNPPYVGEDETVMPEVARYEPSVAVFAAGDGLAVIRRLVTAPVAFMALEMAGHQGDAIESLLRAAGFASVERVRDLAGIERVMVGRR
jgi:release factor glutamine methyltransferase